MKSVVILACLSVCHASVVDAAAPNMLVIVVDDLRWDDLACAGHPFAKTPHMDRVAAEGARFLNAFAVTPLCSPSRATLLTGLYPHTHGITDNTDRSALSHRLITFPQSLQQAGYETAFVGKWHMGNDDSPRPGFHHWVCLQGQGTTHDPELNVNGRRGRESGYVTDVLHGHAMKFLQQPRSQPFLLYVAHKALHPELVQRADGSVSDPNASNFIPAERHQRLYTGERIPRRPNALRAPQNKPALQRTLEGLAPLGPDTGSSDASILGRLRMLASVDESLGDMLAWLQQAGELDRTLVVVTSDHGYFYGEHGLSVERRLAYEEAIRIPLLMRLPREIAPRSTPAEMALTIDLAPTLLDLAGAPPQAGVHGRSLRPLFRGPGTEWRREFLIEYFSDRVFPRIQRMGYQAIRSERWKLIHYTELAGMDELYDLEADPYEQDNVITDPRTQDAAERMRMALRRLLQQTQGE